MTEDLSPHILVVDDDPHLLDATAHLLRTAGYRVSEAADGVDGLRLAAELHPDMILLDVDLPDVDGYEICQRVKADAMLAHTFVVMLSGVRIASDEQVAGLQAGADGYITRPLPNRELTARIETFLRLQRTERALRERVKELNCLYQLSALIERPGVTLDEILQAAVNLLPPAWQYPDIACARLTLDGRAYQSANFCETSWRQSAPIEAHGQTVGLVEVCYLDGSRPFLGEEDDLLNAVAGRLGKAIERIRAEEQLAAALKEKTALLREVHHRVKNNLQSLIYLIDMQAGLVQDAQLLGALRDLQNRMWAMSLVHENLYRESNLARVNFSRYLQDLAGHLLDVMGSGRRIAVQVNVNDVEISIDLAIPCGLIVNELLTNALKYAFPHRPADAQIRVLFREEDSRYLLQVSDNGVGLPPEFDWRSAQSLGLRLVNLWATHQLGGEIAVGSRPGAGVTFIITFAKRSAGAVRGTGWQPVKGWGEVVTQ